MILGVNFLKLNELMIKRAAILVLLCSLGGLAYSQSNNLVNPASAYAKFLGYKTEMRTDSNGNQSRVCVFPDGSICDTWAFFRGICGKEFSYCTLKGYCTETDSTATSKYAVCVCIDSLGKKTRIPLMEFMEQHGDTLIKNQEKRAY